MSNTPISQSELVVHARHAFDLQARAMSATVENGIDDFLTAIHDDIVWRFPIGRYAGTHEGKSSFAEFFRFACSYYPTGLTFHLDRVMTDGENNVAFEFHDEGVTRDGKDYKANVIIVYTMHGDKVGGYREYFG